MDIEAQTLIRTTVIDEQPEALHLYIPSDTTTDELEYFFDTPDSICSEDTTSSCPEEFRHGIILEGEFIHPRDILYLSI